MLEQFKLWGNYRATDALEADKIGRIKVEVYPFLVGRETARLTGNKIDGIDTENLPWATPAPSLFNGAGINTGSFIVPTINTFVWVFFEMGDIYQPVYFAEATDKVHGVPSERLVDYPYTRVLKSSAATLTIDNAAGKENYKITHKSGSVIEMDADGNIIINSAVNVYINS